MSRRVEASLVVSERLLGSAERDYIGSIECGIFLRTFSIARSSGRMILIADRAYLPPIDFSVIELRTCEHEAVNLPVTILSVELHVSHGSKLGQR